MKIITLGEIMVRLSPPDFRRIVQAQTFEVTYGGGEANVAVALANYGLESYFVTKLPTHEIGQAAVNHLRRFGVSDQFIVRDGERVGVYYLENGASQRPSKVVYDRAHSAITTLTPDELDLNALFDGARWFHFTGITPALGEIPRRTVRAAAMAAKAAGATVSCDLNYRAKLWTVEEAQATMRPLMEYVDVCIANEEDAEKCLGMKAGSTNVEGAELDETGYYRLAEHLKTTLDFSTVAITLRESFSASRNGWSAILHDNHQCSEPQRSLRYDIHIVDRVGGGDAFASGLIAGLLVKDDTINALEFAVAASCLKQTIPGDFNHVSWQEVDNLVISGGSGRVVR